LESTDDPSSELRGWSGDCSGSGICTVNLDGNKQVRFSQKQVRMLFSSARNIDGTDTPPNSIYNNVWAVNMDGSDLVPLTTTVAADSFVPQWSPDGTQVLFASNRSLDGVDNSTSVYNLWRMNADGTGLTPLTRGTGTALSVAAGLSQPQWSPDGTEIAFESQLDASGSNLVNPTLASNIWRINADGTGLRPLTIDVVSGIANTSPRWSLDSARIEFLSSRRADGTSNPRFVLDLWQVNGDGTGLIPLSPSSPPVAEFDVGVSEYEWSPDGTQMVFVTDRKGTNQFGFANAADVYRVKADGTGLIDLTNATGLNAGSADAHWSPDGTQIVFTSGLDIHGSGLQNGNLNIWRVKPDGTGLTPLTQATARGADSRNPRWSPDGSEIVFESLRNVDGADAPNTALNIWKMKADGTSPMPLTRSTATAANSSNPLWSPDGTQIVFDSRKNVDGTDTANPNLTSNVWRVKADGSGLVPLGTASASKADSFNAIWSPGGVHVIFLSTRNIDGSNSVNANGTVNIWRANADGSGLSPITRASARSTDCSSFQLRP